MSWNLPATVSLKDSSRRFFRRRRARSSSASRPPPHGWRAIPVLPEGLLAEIIEGASYFSGEDNIPPPDLAALSLGRSA